MATLLSGKPKVVTPAHSRRREKPLRPLQVQILPHVTYLRRKEMRDTFDHKIHPVHEEDLIFPDETSEFMSEWEVLEEKKRKFDQRKMIKDLTKGKVTK